ncbi:MAG: phosphopyruvate hydratase [Candidatus Lokiarchaeota archaeon]|nr:phosphopyruvate hydratase [Candidatus Lokiarchaeota archaeon]
MVDNLKIKKILARWILDSRGNPTVETKLITQSNIEVRAAVPSGASTGEHEALELRDGGKDFLGKGVGKAIKNINDLIAPKLVGLDVNEQLKIDKLMLELDGTENKSKLGANAILSVSLACAKAASACLNIPLYKYLYELAFQKISNKFLLPVPMSNVINGGKHAGGDLAIQEFMILPIGAVKFDIALKMLAETYQNLKKIIKKKWGSNSINVGDEGGFAPAINLTSEALDALVEAIEESGYTVGKDFVFAMDAAASEFFENNKYHIDGKKLSAGQMVDFYKDLIDTYSITSIEDPFDENDFESFAMLTKEIGNKILIVGDDLYVTQVNRIKKGIEMGAANALLLKVNQCGSLMESIEACKTTYGNENAVIVSHRSGETEDTFIADLAVGLCTGLIKTGACCRSERVCKYNQILRISDELGNNAVYAGKNFKDKWKDFQ